MARERSLHKALEQSAPEDRLIGQERAVRLAAALGRLPENQRRAVELRHLRGLPLAEVADELGCSMAAVVGLLHRGVQKRPSVRQRLGRWARRHPKLTVTLVLAAFLGMTVDRWRVGTERDAEAAADQAWQYKEQGRLDLALEAALRAQDRLSWRAGPSLRARVRELATDLRLLNAMEKARLTGAASITTRDELMQPAWVIAGPLYDAAFREYGVDVLTGDEAAVLAALRRRAIQDEICSALDDWTHAVQTPDQRERLQRLAEARGPDEGGAAAQVRRAVPTGNRILGDDLRKQGQFAEAVTELQEALRLQPDCPAAHNDLGVL